MAYDLQQFIVECKSILRADSGPGGREAVRAKLEQLLKEPDFVERYCADDAPIGVHVLFEDPELGFQILAHVYAKARVSPPHDHGASWAIYGQAARYTDVTEWERVDRDGDPKHGQLVAKSTYRLMPGHAAIYQDGMIHSIDYPDLARFVRVTGTNLDKISRRSFNLESGEVTQMQPVTAS